MLIRRYPPARTTPRATHRISSNYSKRHPDTDTTRYADRELVVHYLTRRE
jgi:hypothetical protein